jgi:hypothetical protein
MRHEQEANVKASDGFRLQANALLGQGFGTSAVEGAWQPEADLRKDGEHGYSDDNQERNGITPATMSLRFPCGGPAREHSYGIHYPRCIRSSLQL